MSSSLPSSFIVESASATEQFGSRLPSMAAMNSRSWFSKPLMEGATPAQIAYAIPHEPALTQLLNGPLPANDAELASFARALGAILDRVDPLPPSEPTTPPVSTSDPTDHPDERPIQ